MDAQELQNPKKVSKVWAKNLDPAVKTLNNTVSSMIGMKPQDAIKLGAVPFDKKYPEETVLPESGLYRFFISLVNNMETKRDRQQTLSGVKIRID